MVFNATPRRIQIRGFSEWNNGKGNSAIFTFDDISVYDDERFEEAIGSYRAVRLNMDSNILTELLYLYKVTDILWVTYEKGQHDFTIRKLKVMYYDDIKLQKHKNIFPEEFI